MPKKKSQDVEEEVLDLIQQASDKQIEADSLHNKTSKEQLNSEAENLIQQAEEILKKKEESEDVQEDKE